MIIDPDVREKFRVLCQLGKQIEGTSPNVDIKRKPDYFIEERFKRAQQTINKFYTSASMASSVGLMLLLQLKCILDPLLKTGRSQTVTHLWDRYTATVKYIRSCYETEFFDEASDGWRYILIVRGMHQRIHKLMNEQHSNLLNDDSSQNQKIVWVNQYDMAITQFAFIGLLLLEPEKCAAYSIKEDELLDIVHYWRLLSYYFGIEDQFNIFAYDNNWSKQKQLMQLIMDEVYRKELEQNRQPVGSQMAQGFMLAFEEMLTESSFNILDHWWSPVISISGRQQLAPYSKLELYKLARFLFFFKVLFKSEFLVVRLNRLYKKKFDNFLTRGDKVKKRLEKKYGHIRYEEREVMA